MDPSPPPPRRTSRWATNLSPRGNVLLGITLAAAGLAALYLTDTTRLRMFGVVFLACGAALVVLGLAGVVKE